MSRQRQNHQTGTVWEARVGYSRAVRVGDTIHVAGTTAINEHGQIVGIGDAGAQAAQILQNIESALRACGAEMRHVVRTRIFVTNIARDWETIGKAHGAVFGAIRPAATMVEVSRLISDEMLVEMEAEAIVHDADESAAPA